MRGGRWWLLLTSMGMRPIGFARRKHMGATDSCRGQEEVSARKAMYIIDALNPRKVVLTFEHLLYQHEFSSAGGQRYICSYLHQDQNIQRVIVLAESPGDEAVVVRVHHRGVEDSVNVEHTCHPIEYTSDG